MVELHPLKYATTYWQYDCGREPGIRNTEWTSGGASHKWITQSGIFYLLEIIPGKICVPDVMIQSGIELYVYTVMVTKWNQNIRGDGKPEAWETQSFVKQRLEKGQVPVAGAHC